MTDQVAESTHNGCRSTNGYVHICGNRAGGSNLTVVRPFPKKGGLGVLPQKILEKCCLLVHSGTHDLKGI